MQNLLPESYRFAAPEWTIPAAILLIAVLATGIVSYAKRGWNAATLVGLLLRTIATVCLCFCLLQPMHRRELPRPGANVMAVVVDSSLSMTIKPTGETLSRFGRIKQLLPADTAWQTRLAQDFDVRRYTFDSQLKSTDDFSSLQPTGTVSNLQSVLETLSKRFQNRPVAGVMLFTDGISQPPTTEEQARTLGMPVHVVVDDKEAAAVDVAVDSPTVIISSFDLAPVTLQCNVSANQLDGRELSVRVLDENEKTIETQVESIDSNRWNKKFRFRFRPEQSGLSFVTVIAGLSEEVASDNSLRQTTEVTNKNNSRLVAINRSRGPFRVLYVSGRPNWELKYLRRALEEDVELEFNSLIRVAREEPKFSFRDMDVADVNPLIAGFTDDTETAEQYDEPVFTTLGPSSDLLQKGFPASEEDLFRYHAIILDDVEASFFKTEQQLQIREFVSRRGGGFMMLGGIDSFEDGGYQRTPIAELLPVYLAENARAAPIAGELPARLSPTKDGKLQTWLRLRASKSAEARRFDAMPSFEIWSRTGRLKPGATEFASLLGDEAAPGLSGQNFGRGRTLALAVGDYWRWGIERKDTGEDDLGQFWRQTVRWLTNDAPSRVEAEVAAPANAAQPHQLRIRVLTATHEADEDARVQLTVTGPDETEVRITADPDPSSAGYYLAEYYSRDDGAYRCEIRVTDSQGESLEPRTIGWAAQPTAEEFRTVDENREMLNRIASASGGVVVRASELEAFAKSLPNRRVPITVTKWEAIWQSPWLLMFTVLMLCTEWGLRRWRGMP